MDSISNNSNDKNIVFNIEGNSSLLSKDKAKVNEDGGNEQFMQELSTALNELSSLEDSSKLREDAIRNGKAIIANWKPPTDDQIDKIMQKMKNDLLP